MICDITITVHKVMLSQDNTKWCGRHRLPSAGRWHSRSHWQCLPTRTIVHHSSPKISTTPVVTRQL